MSHASASPSALTLAVCDLMNEVDNVRDGLRAYQALRDLLMPWHIMGPLETENLDMVNRGGLAILLDILNASMEAGLGKTDARAEAIRELEKERSQA